MVKKKLSPLLFLTHGLWLRGNHSSLRVGEICLHRVHKWYKTSPWHRHYWHALLALALSVAHFFLEAKGYPLICNQLEFANNSNAWQSIQMAACSTCTKLWTGQHCIIKIGREAWRVHKYLSYDGSLDELHVQWTKKSPIDFWRSDYPFRPLVFCCLPQNMRRFHNRGS